MTVSFCWLNLKGISGLFSAELRCYIEVSICDQLQERGASNATSAWGSAGEGRLTTWRVSLNRQVVPEKARVCCGLATRAAERTAERKRKGVILEAIAEDSVSADWRAEEVQLGGRDGRGWSGMDELEGIPNEAVTRNVDDGLWLLLDKYGAVIG